MRKTYNFIYLINIICGFLLFFNFLYVYETIDKYNDLIFALVFIFYVVADILFFRKRFIIEKIDLTITTIYILTCLSIFIYSVYYQMMMPYVFSMVYFNLLLIIPHVLYIVYNVLRCYK
jgi:hypothetical protein